jgi:hypothetical protein
MTDNGAFRLAASLAVAVFASFVVSVTTAGTTVTLPIEIVGENGTTSSVTVDVPARRAREARSLWMQIDRLKYADMVSVRVIKSAWFSLNNDTVAAAEPGRSYGGIGRQHHSVPLQPDRWGRSGFRVFESSLTVFLPVIPVRFWSLT